MMERLTPDRVKDFPVVVHGTYIKAWPMIREAGLSKMRRQHVHLATGLPDGGGVVSGMRKSSEILVYINLAKAVADQVEFFVSKNGVILTPGDASGYLASKYFATVIDVGTGRDMLQDIIATPNGQAAAAAAVAMAAPVAASVHPTDKLQARVDAAGLTADCAKAWVLLHQNAPKSGKGKPSPELMTALQTHKAKVKTFLMDLAPEQRTALTGKRVGAQREQTQRPEKKTKSRLHVAISPLDRDVMLGWDDTAHRFNDVLPFYSHSRRSKQEAAEDATHGIDRRVFSNLFADTKPLQVGPLLDADGRNLMRYDWLAESNGVCSESFFQAAKCEHEFDARFIVSDLDANDAARSGYSISTTMPCPADRSPPINLIYLDSPLRPASPQAKMLVASVTYTHFTCGIVVDVQCR
jgi:hypothetical protein